MRIGLQRGEESPQKSLRLVNARACIYVLLSVFALDRRLELKGIT